MLGQLRHGVLIITESHGSTIVRPGMPRKIATSSVAWCDGPYPVVSGQATYDVDVEPRLGDVEADEIVGAARCGTQGWVRRKGSGPSRPCRPPRAEL